LFALIPHLRVHGKPAILLDIVNRHFTLLGFTFLPTDSFLLALFMLSLILGIFFFTALFGRVWCGWACPQTVYMEFLFRPIERLLTGRAGQGGAPTARAGIWRLPLLYAAYLAASLFLAHTFLAYFVGVDQLRIWITHSPFDHPAAFIVMAATTGLMLFDFCFFREQTCIIACPYGRFQSVLLDRNSLRVAYDPTRGEPRGSAKKHLKIVPGESAPRHGDCIDCTLCVQVCPTGIDIRDGLQLECVGCAQCIDACDQVMAKIGRPRGLIRYSSQAGLEGKPRHLLRPRLFIYMGILAVLLSALAFMLVNKSPFDVGIMRNYGRPFVLTDDGKVINEFRIKITDRTPDPMSYQISVANHPGIVVQALDQISLAPGQMFTEPVQIIAPAAAFSDGAIDAIVRVQSSTGAIVDQSCRLLGPYSLPAASQP
jgi:cytochrome c oxidase accessory protein FixG